MATRPSDAPQRDTAEEGIYATTGPVVDGIETTTGRRACCGQLPSSPHLDACPRYEPLRAGDTPAPGPVCDYCGQPVEPRWYAPTGRNEWAHRSGLWSCADGENMATVNGSVACLPSTVRNPAPMTPQEQAEAVGHPSAQPAARAASVAAAMVTVRRHHQGRSAMRGWEAFGVEGVEGADDPRVRELGGTEDWPPPEVHGGVAGISVDTYADDLTGACIIAWGPDRDAVTAAWHRARAAFVATAAGMWTAS